MVTRPTGLKTGSHGPIEGSILAPIHTFTLSTSLYMNLRSI